MTTIRNVRRTALAAAGMIMMLAVFFAGCTNPLQIVIPAVTGQGAGHVDPAPVDDPPVQEPEPVPEPEDGANTAQRVVIETREFTLAWDFSLPEPGTFSVYYRAVDSEAWNLLKDGLSSSSLSIDDTMLDFGEYEFAVRFVSDTGVASELHTSLDKTAIPTTGWYVAWVES